MARATTDDFAARGSGWWQRRRTRELALVACFLLPSLTIFFLYRVLPLGWNVLLSLQYWSPLKPAHWAGLDHYEEMLIYDEVFWQALKNTLIFIGASPFAIALALGIALLVNGNLKGAAVYRSIVFLSYPLMTVAVGIICAGCTTNAAASSISRCARAVSSPSRSHSCRASNGRYPR